MGHVSDADLERFSRGGMTAEALVPFVEHLAECETCARRLRARRSTARQYDAVVEEVLGVGDHVSEDDLHAYVDGRLPAEQREIFNSHLERCAACAAEVSELQAFAATYGAAPARRSWALRALAAAAVLLIALAGVVGWRLRPSYQAPPSAENRTPPRQVEQRQPDGSQRPEGDHAPAGGASAAPLVVSLLLAAHTSRSADVETTPTAAVFRETKELRLEVACDDAEFPRYRVTVQTATGATVLSRDGLEAVSSQSGRRVVVSLGADGLEATDYIMTLSGVTQDGASENISKSLFRVERP